MEIRPFRSGDLQSLYAISLATGDRGGDASALYRDGRLVGHIYSAPYAQMEPALVFVAEDEEGVGGFVLGTLDTAGFEDRLEEIYWPALRAVYPEPSGDRTGWDADQRRSFLIHHPRRAPASVVRDFPAHLHLNLLPRLQGRGFGQALLDHWLGIAVARASRGVHVASNPGNNRAIRFWSANGFVQVEGGKSAVWQGRSLI